MAVMFVIDVVGRLVARTVARKISPAERVLVVGEQDRCQDLAARLCDVPGVELAGIISIGDHEWSVEGLVKVVDSHRAHRIVVGPYGSWREPTVIDLIRTAKWIGVRVSIMPNVMTVIGAATIVDTLDSMLLLGVPRFGLTRSSLLIKRTMDLVLAAFFLVVLNDTGRIPVETHSGTLEFGMIDEARTLEHSGAPLALLKWGAAMKQLILYTILINVFVAPWGLAASGSPGAVALAIPALLGKAMVLGIIFAVIDNLFAKLRLFKITEFIAAAFLIAVLAVLVFYAGGG
jgi:hypothetical protein